MPPPPDSAPDLASRPHTGQRSFSLTEAEYEEKLDGMVGGGAGVRLDGMVGGGGRCEERMDGMVGGGSGCRSGRWGGPQ